jgi:DNA polymerase-3 subunit epsilon
MLLINDTETTGFPNASKTARDPAQARVVQTAFILADEAGRTLAEVCFLIRPDGWVIGPGAFAAHGLTAELCEQYGVSSRHAFETFLELASRAKTYIAHNVDFDWKMLGIEAEAHGLKMPAIPGKFCTMKEAKKLGIKATLGSALKHYTGRDIGENAHDALVDCRACRDIYFAVKPPLITEPANDDDAALFADLV